MSATNTPEIYSVVYSSVALGWFNKVNNELYSKISNHDSFKNLIDKEMMARKTSFKEISNSPSSDSVFDEFNELGVIISERIPRHHPDLVTLVKSTPNVLAVDVITVPEYIVRVYDDGSETILTY